MELGFWWKGTLPLLVVVGYLLQYVITAKVACSAFLQVEQYERLPCRAPKEYFVVSESDVGEMCS